MRAIQVVVWVAAPAMIRAGLTTPVMTVLLVSFLLEYLPKIYHAARLLRRMQRQSGYIFGTIWWGIALNLMAYFVAAHVRYVTSSASSVGCHCRVPTSIS
jgi:cyclic nucleotide gated channel, plant